MVEFSVSVSRKVNAIFFFHSWESELSPTVDIHIHPEPGLLSAMYNLEIMIMHAIHIRQRQRTGRITLPMTCPKMFSRTVACYVSVSFDSLLFCCHCRRRRPSPSLPPSLPHAPSRQSRPSRPSSGRACCPTSARPSLGGRAAYGRPIPFGRPTDGRTCVRCE